MLPLYSTGKVMITFHLDKDKYYLLMILRLFLLNVQLIDLLILFKNLHLNNEVENEQFVKDVKVSFFAFISEIQNCNQI